MTSQLRAGDESARESAGSKFSRPFIGWLAILYWAALFVATHVPIPQIPMEDVGSDKVVHVAAFAGLGFLTALWLVVNNRLSVRNITCLVIVLLVYAALDEWLQQFVDRHTDPADWAADAIGALIGVGCVLLLPAVRSLRGASRGDFANSHAGNYDVHQLREQPGINASLPADGHLSTEQR